MEVHRIVISVIDFDGIGVDAVCDVLRNTRYPNDCISPGVVEARSAYISEWSDDHPLNKAATAGAELQRLFS